MTVFSYCFHFAITSSGTSFIFRIGGGGGQEKLFENFKIQNIYTEADFYIIFQ